MGRNTRIHKGESFIEMPMTYSVIDIETTGLSPEYDEIIEVSAIKVCNNKIVDTFTSLVQPRGYEYEDDEYPDVLFHEYVSDFISQLTGITNDMLSTAPSIQDVLPKYLEFIGNDMLLGHNINFDINFLYDYSMQILSKPLKNDFVDTMRLFRKIHPELAHHRLVDFADTYGVSYEGAHRSLADCNITLLSYLNMFEEIKEKNIDILSLKKRKGVKSADITAQIDCINVDNPMYGQVFVFTGTLEHFTRTEAMQIVANHGGINSDNLNKKTNFLVLGNNDYKPNVKNGRSNKLIKAEKYKLSGCNIEIISENVFLDMIDDHSEE